MTIREFQDHAWGAASLVTHCRYPGRFEVCSVNFIESLLCICPEGMGHDEEEWMWVRCENVELINRN